MGDPFRRLVSCVRLAPAGLLVAVAAAGCASGSGPASPAGPAVISAGQLPPSAVLVGGKGAAAALARPPPPSPWPSRTRPRPCSPPSASSSRA